MAIQFHPLPVEVFDDEARPYIVRLNRELRELFALEGVIRNPVDTRRSDQSIVRRSEPQVDVSRITPSLSAVLSGSSTVIGAPALVFGTANLVGTTRTVVSVNSSVALFGTALPLGLTGSGVVGTSAFAARADHQHPLTDTLNPSGSTATLVLTDGGVNQTLTGNRGALEIRSVGDVNIATGLNVAMSSNLMSTFGGTASIPATLVPSDANDSLVTYKGTTTSAVRAFLAINQWTGSAASTTAKAMGFNAFSYHGGSGNLGTNTNSGGLMAGRMGVRFAVAAATGGVSFFSGLGIANQWISPGAAVTATEGVGLNIENTTLSGLTITNQYSCIRMASPSAVGSLPLMHGLLIDSLTVGTTKYAIKSSQKIVNIGTDIGTEAAGKGFYCLDANDGNFYRIGTSAGAIFITNLGTVAPAS